MLPSLSEHSRYFAVQSAISDSTGEYVCEPQIVSGKEEQAGAPDCNAPLRVVTAISPQVHRR